MNTIINERAELFTEYIDSFDGLWSRESQKEYFEKTLNGFNSETKRKNIERISEKIIGQDYQSLHHFMTTSPWDRNEMNENRINFMKKQSNAFPEKKGILVIDDSGVMKRGTARSSIYWSSGQSGERKCFRYISSRK